MRHIEERYISLLTDSTRTELREYQDSLKAFRDMRNTLDNAKKEGLEEGLIKGEERETKQWKLLQK